jgi:hypothetical protein
VTDRVPGYHTLLLFRPNTCLPDLFHCGLLFTAVHYSSYVQMNRFERQQQMLRVSPPSICLVPSFHCRTHPGRHCTGSCLVCTVSKVSPKIYIQTYSRRSQNMILRGSPEQLSTCDFPLHLVGSTECHWLCHHINLHCCFVPDDNSMPSPELPASTYVIWLYTSGHSGSVSSPSFTQCALW